MNDIIRLEDIFNILIELESMGNKLYMEMQLLTSDNKLIELFGTLAQQEEAHKALYEKYKKANIAPNAKVVSADYQRHMSALLAGTIHFIKEHNDTKDFNHGFKIAINLEKDTILFLNELKQVIDPAYNDILDNIIDQEHSHLQFLYKYLEEM